MHSLVRTGDGTFQQAGCFVHGAARSKAPILRTPCGVVKNANDEVTQEALDEASPKDIARRTFERNALVGNGLSVEVDTAKGWACREKHPRINLGAAEAFVFLGDKGLDLREEQTTCVGGCEYVSFPRNMTQGS